MGKHIAILYFSGTGNSAAVACLLRDELSAGGDVAVFAIEDILLNKIPFNSSGYDCIGIGYPSYGFNAPPIVSKFAKTLIGSGDTCVFLFMTCAGPCYINDIASFGLKRILSKRGFRIVYEKVFCMPANILIRYRDEIARQLYETAARKAHAMAADILSGKPCVRKDGVFAMLLRGLYVWCDEPMLRFLSLDFRVRNSCTKCSKCVNNCPGRNIRLKEGNIRFGANCAGCYRCVYNCPQRAIAGRLFNFAIFKGGYDIGRIIRDDNIDGNFITKDTKGLFKTLFRYLNDS